MDLQPTYLKDTHVTLVPLQQSDFERLYEVASDPLIWEQHHNKNRYRREVFTNYFAGAIASKGAVLILDSQTGHPIGCSRFYDYNVAEQSICIGSFLARDHWGSTYNHSVKALMLNHAFRFVESVVFHVGVLNIRSQKSIEKIGAIKEKEIDLARYGETPNPHYVYRITKEAWQARD